MARGVRTDRRVYKRIMRKKQTGRSSKSRAYSKPARKAMKKTYKRAKRTGSALPVCTQKYAAGLIDPSDPAVIGACFPSGLTIPSEKFHQRLTGTLTIGTGGYGYIVAGNTTANDYNAIIHSSATTNITNATAINTDVGAVPRDLTQGSYSILQHTNNSIEGRLVCYGMKLKYAGRQDAMQGTLVAIEEPDHQTLWSQTPDEITAHRAGKQMPVTNDWIAINFSGPIRNTETEYNSTGYSGSPLAFPLGVIINAQVGAIFHFEANYHVEYHGLAAKGATYNDIDQLGVGKIINAAKKDQEAGYFTHSNVIGVLTTGVATLAANPEVRTFAMEAAKKFLGI